MLPAQAHEGVLGLVCQVSALLKACVLFLKLVYNGALSFKRLDAILQRLDEHLLLGG